MEALADGGEWDFSYLWSNSNQTNTNCYLKIEFQKKEYSDYTSTHFYGTKTTSPSSTTVYGGELSGSYFGAGFVVGGKGYYETTNQSGNSVTWDYTTEVANFKMIDVTCCYLGGFESCTPVNC